MLLPQKAFWARRVTVWVAVFIGMAGVLSSCGAFPNVHRAFVFAINLSSSPQELQVFEDGKVVANFANLIPNVAHSLVEVTTSHPVTLERVTASEKPLVWNDTSGTPYTVALIGDNVWVAMVSPNGQPSLVAMHQNTNNQPKIAFLNTTPNILAQVELAPDFNKNIKVYLQNLPPGQPSEFSSIEPKPMTIFWQTVGQNFTGDYFQIKVPDRLPVAPQFSNGHYYLALLGNGLGPNAHHGQIQDITPRSF